MGEILTFTGMVIGWGWVVWMGGYVTGRREEKRYGATEKHASKVINIPADLVCYLDHRVCPARMAGEHGGRSALDRQLPHHGQSRVRTWRTVARDHDQSGRYGR